MQSLNMPLFADDLAKLRDLVQMHNLPGLLGPEEKDHWNEEDYAFLLKKALEHYHHYMMTLELSGVDPRQYPEGHVKYPK